MKHYVCTGCGGVAINQGVCQTVGCSLHGQPLKECNCSDPRHLDKLVGASKGSSSYQNLHVLNFGLAVGISMGVYFILIGLTATFTGWGVDLVYLFGTFYRGFSATVLGSLIGGIWAFVDSFIGAVIIAWVYNALCKRK